MEEYKIRLYNAYVSSGQAALGEINDPNILFSNNRFYIQHLIDNYLSNIPKNSRIVDVGCGHGAHIYFLHKNNYTNIYGFDISKEQINLGHKIGVKSIEHKSIEQFCKDNKDPVDVFLLIDLLEHLTYNELFTLLDKLYLQLGNNGKLVIHVPNAEGIFGMQIRYGDLTHETAFTPKSINQLLTTIGFTQIVCYEDKPIVHGVKSFVRRVLWELLTLKFRLLAMAETGTTNNILSRNMLVVAKKTL